MIGLLFWKTLALQFPFGANGSPITGSNTLANVLIAAKRFNLSFPTPQS
jgi:hypothetical protein